MSQAYELWPQLSSCPAPGRAGASGGVQNAGLLSLMGLNGEHLRCLRKF